MPVPCMFNPCKPGLPIVDPRRPGQHLLASPGTAALLACWAYIALFCLQPVGRDHFLSGFCTSNSKQIILRTALHPLSTAACNLSMLKHHTCSIPSSQHKGCLSLRRWTSAPVVRRHRRYACSSRMPRAEASSRPTVLCAFTAQYLQVSVVSMC